MKKNDYILFKDITEKGTRYHLAQAVKPTSDGLLVDIEKDRHIEPKRIEIYPHQVVLNFGKDPEPGMAYGHDLSYLYRGVISTDYGVDVHKFSKFNEAVEESVTKSIGKAFKLLKSAGLLCVANIPMVYEIKQKTSKYKGMFKSSGKKASRITLFMHEEFVNTDLDSYVWLHEIGHAIDHHLVTSPELRARWVKLYMQSIKSTTVELAEARAMWKPFTNSTSVGHWKSCFEEDTEKAKTNLILRMIKQAHGLSANDINALMTAEDFDTIKALWPKDNLHSTELNPLITEYATNSVKETFAEAFALHLTETKLPKQVVRLVEDTIQHAMSNRDNLSDD